MKQQETAPVRVTVRARRALFGFWLAIILPIALLSGATAAQAQEEEVWVQIEAQPSLREAEDRLRLYAARLPDVAGFQLDGRWYGIVLGPYDRTGAEQRLAALRLSGQIPSDSYLTFPNQFRRQFWPIGVQAGRARAVSPIAPETPAPQAPQPAALPETPPVADETLAQARASEAQLLKTEKEALQVMLRWAGTYSGAIDGAFGRGTRAAMAAWQQQKGFEETGVLTTAQRAALLRDYNAILEGLELSQVEDAQAGVSVVMPTALVTRSDSAPPFARYDAKGDGEVRVILISQPGGRDALKGLFDILQTLAIMPPEGARTFDRSRFDMTGANSRIVSQAFAQTDGLYVKGVILVWPVGDDARHARVWQRMRASFRSIPGGLDPLTTPPDEEQSVDLVSGLEVRKPRRTGTGFFIDESGQLITANLGSCEVLQLADETPLRVVLQDETLDLMVLDPIRGVAPLAIGRFQSSPPAIQQEVVLAGFSYGGLLGAPTLTFGRIADLTGLRGERALDRLAMTAFPGDVGGPVFDRSGAIVGILRTRSDDGGRVLPEEVNFTTDSRALRDRLDAAGIAITLTGGEGGVMDPNDLQDYATDMTVVVECWD